jgi:hypothetical protein
LGTNAQKYVKNFSIDQKGVPLADSKNPYSLISLIRYNQQKFARNQLFKEIDSISQVKIRLWNRSNPKEKIALNSFLQQSDTPLKDENGKNIEIPLPDGTICFKYPLPDTIFYSLNFNQISVIYSAEGQIPETIQLYRKTSKNSFLLAEFPADLLMKTELTTYSRIDPITEKNYINYYLKHVENTKIRFGKNGISQLIIKDILNNYYDEHPFYKHFLFDSLYSINDQKAKLQQILRKPIGLIYDTTYHSLTNIFGDDSLVRDSKLGDLINVIETQVDTLFAVNEVHSIYKQQIITYNTKNNLFEITEEAIFICLEDPRGTQLIIDKISNLPYPYPNFTTKEDIHQTALKYELNNNPLRKLLNFHLPGRLFSFEQLFEGKEPKQKRGKEVEVIDIAE